MKLLGLNEYMAERGLTRYRVCKSFVEIDTGKNISQTTVHRLCKSGSALVAVDDSGNICKIITKYRDVKMTSKKNPPTDAVGDAPLS